MLRRLYRVMLRLHPRRFRQRFSAEMLYAFDQSPSASLLFDAARSALCQHLLRPAVDEPAASATLNFPAFAAVQASALPGRSMLAHGAMVTLAAWLAIALAIDSGNHHMQRLSGTRMVAWSAPHESPEFPRLLGRSVGVAERHRDTLKSMMAISPSQPGAVSSRRRLLSPIRVHDRIFAAIDLDNNGALSEAEIAAAPEFLRALDADRNGVLTPAECGGVTPFFSLLDRDGNRELSAREIAGMARVLERAQPPGTAPTVRYR